MIKLSESLARDGYRDEDMDALVNDASKFLPTNDLGLLVWLAVMSQDEAVTVLSNQGYDQQTASKVIIADGLRRLDAIHRTVADAAVAAFVDGRIDSSALDTVLQATLGDSQERAALTDAADARRQLHLTDLTPAEAKAAVLAGISPISDYTDALSARGRTPDAILVLEFLLRKEQDDKTTLDAHKAAAQAARDAAAKAKADAAATHLQVVADAAARKALGSLGTLERAAIHGLIPISRLGGTSELGIPGRHRRDLRRRRAAARDGLGRGASEGRERDQDRGAETHPGRRSARGVPRPDPECGRRVGAARRGRAGAPAT